MTVDSKRRRAWVVTWHPVIRSAARVFSAARLKTAGFTVLETMIVLGISSGLFVAVAATMSGKRNRTEFAHAVQDIRSNMEQVINEAGSGFYADATTFGCVPNLATGPQISSSPVANPGTNRCMFLGKAIQFNRTGTSRQDEFKTYAIVGNQKDAQGDDIDNYGTAAAGDAIYADTLPTVVAPTTLNPSVDRSINGRLLYGLTMKGMKYYSDAYHYTQVTINPPTPDVVTGTRAIRGYFDGSGDGPVDNVEQWFYNGFGIDLGGNPRPVRGMDRFELYLCTWFVAPETGTYTFGGWGDDDFSVRVNWNNANIGGWSTDGGACRSGSWQWPTHFVYGYNRNSGGAQYQRSVSLVKNQAYAMHVDLWNRGGASNVYVTVTSPGGAINGVIPSSYLYAYRPTIIPGTTPPPTYTDITVPTALKDISAVAFVNNLAAYGSDTLLTGGSQSLNMVPVNGTGPAEILPNDPQYARKMADAIVSWFRDKTAPGATKAPFSVNPREGVTMCFVSDGSEQSGLITIGGGGRQMSVTLKISEDKTCGGLYP